MWSDIFIVLFVFSVTCFGINQASDDHERLQRDIFDDEAKGESAPFGSRITYPDGIAGETKRTRNASPSIREPKSNPIPSDPLQTNEIPNAAARAGSNVEVKDISCMKMSSREKFVATIVGPAGQQIFPLFEARPGVDPKTSRVCQIQATNRAGTYKMDISNLDSCGVQVCPQDNQSWLCVSLRIPVVPGLKLPEDELILVKCKPQDRIVSEKKESDFNGASLAIQAAAVERRSPLAFSGGKQEFLCEIGLFRRLPGTALFSQRVTSGTLVDLGEEVQLRSIVRSGDGWNYAKLTDVVVRRLRRDQSVAPDSSDVANLVLADGCRNPAFKMIAPTHPQRDSRNSLLQNFNFRVFLFQDMEDGDSILVSARVLGCVESIDCAPSLCADDRQQGYGRRRRSVESKFDPKGKLGEIREFDVHRIFHSNGTEQAITPEALKGWETDMAVKVIMPKNSFEATRVDPIEHHCFLFVILSTALGSAFIVLVVALFVYCACRRPAKVIEPVYPQPIPPQPQNKLTDIYNEIELLDVLSKTIREKKQRVHEEILSLYEKNEEIPKEEAYEKGEARSMRQIKRRSGVITIPKKLNNGYVTNVNLCDLSDRQTNLMAQV